MIKNSPEYKDAVQKSYNKLARGILSPLAFQNWRLAFESGFDAKEDEEKRRKKEAETVSAFITPDCEGKED
jgi:hypothetical protein